ncbi:aspartate aminotransferase family protein [Flavobacterium lindanitolerans]|jgi:acetylornithine/N-succinyldiaminopimelate aminotransferase|uniref:Acetylornithine/succinyldiaminopimelate/putresci ne aminotransferase n=1 Tax=Flavobacterium lindanitolerans TaxID=428988 RepID=A0A497U483_9FLAO|nr:aspartate aminotransferase family protein [Flavobacterium lindanitolerans]MDQ7961690.1 aspartate aminotransferase family protein [Flavobacterium lindanitolerans]PKW20049.1 acetylornithine/succinyldiaminopimelate/putrescine aminotransferase [Flavobacterium lindanitolerans]RLJ23148.1 acetylornithine/succinyldiaminopimelate/putrescine aminotransferase [Flavobacterium lindanitolerans]THD30430.1 MAG: aspartate aminotransferase family protein [Flavobacterium johnsoniae]
MNKDFQKYQAQTSPYPLGMEVSHAIGSYIYDTNNKKYLDFVAGVSACTLGHQNKRVNDAIKNQLDKYSHVMVYGEYSQNPAVEFCKLLASLLPKPLEKTYLVNSGTEATEGALKLARRVTGRSQLISCNNAYHGNTMGSMSVMGFEERKRAFRPLIPDVDFITFNNEEDLKKITTKTAGIILESIQGGAGFIQPENGFLKKVRERCTEVGAMMIIDEIQPGFGRTGKLFGFENYDVVPDIIILGKGMGGGMPVGAFTASSEMMDLLSDNPKLGHITTFGGHPVIAAASLATLQEITETDLIPQTLEKEKLFRSLLVHPLIKEIRGRGLMLAAMTEDAEITNQIILKCQDKGLILFWLLFEGKAIRITPPLTISEEEIKEGCAIMLEVMDEVYSALKN